MNRRATLATLAFAASILGLGGGCYVRAGHGSQGLYGHSNDPNYHCHQRGGKHEKTVRHSHPHGPDHR